MYQVYPEEYFSSADIRIKLGNEWIDEVVGLSFSMVEQVKPIHGYASRTYDVVARGKRTITGQFAINFKNDNYLYDKINSYINKVINQETNSNNSLIGRDSYRPPGTQTPIDEILYKPQGIEEFEWAAEQQIQRFWGNEDINMNPPDVDPYFYAINKEHLTDLNQKERQKIYEKINKLRRDGFTLEVYYGDNRSLSGMRNNKAVRKIYGVQLTGFGQQIQLAGQPVREQYSFIAKDISR